MMPQLKSISKICFIINPISGKGRAKGIAELIEKYLDKSKFTYEILYTTAKGDATRLSKDASEKGLDLVIAVGGDGTVHEVGKALIHTNTALGIIPAGSGNGLALHCNIPTDPKKAIELINRMTLHDIDTIQVDMDHYLNMAGIGFDAHIAWRFAEHGKRGLFNYIKLILFDYFSYKNNEYNLTIDGKTISRQSFLISFANSAQYGNNFRISPHSKINDGYLDVVILHPFSTWSAPSMLFNLLRSQPSKYIEIIPAKEVIIHGGPFKAHMDGEPATFNKDACLKINPNSLKLLCEI